MYSTEEIERNRISRRVLEHSNYFTRKEKLTKQCYEWLEGTENKVRKGYLKFLIHIVKDVLRKRSLD